ncbi:restriction endonuclease subunit S [Pseudomonas aeruginosa]|uniref:restriction endonuclease subunit S n=1 Tax=Pseudomonas aeruginosa TaxID=287 RepID=UPI001D09A59F|nr:restriction endonuclease subunit S [Pseudomonas aeruginosa]EKV8086390.1 restriction endonuclease subunit S [Pseudomonas aeruginosa]MCC0228681.1 restriction endonuclease subunit S [Pseudomonas aeruginosa]MDU0702927.1 restriction endonuclease subunit S [Pseudomonas aeruginosa]HBO5683543.1 restriction endonuclease subunit S [Pseudomonas aeruginosa]HDU8951013.1 restriction endonuclease subunit S [Pseudomonas aeruginosa]
MTGIKFIENLLDGADVEWKELGGVIKLEKGRQLNKELLSDDGLYPAYNGGVSYSGFTDTFNYSENKTIVSQGGASAGFVNFVTTKFYANAHCYVVLPNTEEVLNRYVYHFLKLNQERLTGKQHGAGIPALRTSEILEISIPIPCPENPKKSLEIQAEIVRILDAFTSLTAELTTELTARKKQYNYYRDQLLSFKDRDVEWTTLGRLAENLDSMRKPITSGLRVPGDTPYYGASGIVDYVKGYIFDGDFLLVSEDGANLVARNTPIAFSISGKNWVNNHAHVLKFETYAERRYVEYYLNNIDLTPYISGAAQPKLNKKNLESISIPNPSPEEKRRIVSILDKFDALTNSTTEGLPREIELRQKQYEYYRKLLLSFPKPEKVES